MVDWSTVGPKATASSLFGTLEVRGWVPDDLPRPVEAKRRAYEIAYRASVEGLYLVIMGCHRELWPEYQRGLKDGEAERLRRAGGFQLGLFDIDEGRAS